ncbi:MAG TPA: nitrilase-related carbon-nitrogen hydrolase [Phycisphaerae bacterium]|jgi:predicted amidohydrolase
MARHNRIAKVAAVQIAATTLQNAPAALSAIERGIRSAAAHQAELVVLPECAYPSYLLSSAQAYRNSGCLAADAFLDRLAALVREAQLHVVCGFVEDTGERLYNSAAVVGPDGELIGRYRKLFMWGADRDYFAPGAALPVFETGVGRLGVIICADARAPEIVAALAQQHVELIAMPTCWVNLAQTPGEFRNPQPEFLIPARARELGVPFVCANKFGMESPAIGYCGRSMIVSADGAILAEAPPVGEALITASLTLHPSARPRLPTWTRDRILSQQPAERPAVSAQTPMCVAVLPAALVERVEPADLFAALTESGVEFLIGPAPRRVLAEHLTIIGRSYGITVAAWPTPQRVLFDKVGTYAWMNGEEARGFAPARSLALEGAAAIIVTHPPHDEAVLRTRALENRVYVFAVSNDQAQIFAPDGALLAACHQANAPLIATVDFNQAADKTVFAGTDIWEQRQPRLYAETLAHARKVSSARASSPV